MIYQLMIKLVFIVIAALLLNLIPTGGICTDAVDYGFCTQNKGFPFPSIFSAEGEFDIIPPNYAERFWNERVIGTIANTIIASAIVLVITRFTVNQKKLKPLLKRRGRQRIRLLDDG